MTRAPIVARMVALCALLFAFTMPGFAEIIKVENPQALPVLDKAGLLTQEQISHLNVELRTLADTDGTQFAVLTVPTTGAEDDFTFAQRTASDWGIGQKKNGNGILMVVASKDRRVRIQVGYGLEGRLTDALSRRIIEREILPEFRKGNWYGGINNGVNAIIKAVRGEYKAPPANQQGGYGWIFPLVLFIIIVFVLSSAGRGGGGGGGGGRRSPWIFPVVWTTGGSGGGGWSGGGGGGFSGGGGFGGGFGGGGFGGGGASGGW